MLVELCSTISLKMINLYKVCVKLAGCGIVNEPVPKNLQGANGICGVILSRVYQYAPLYDPIIWRKQCESPNLYIRIPYVFYPCSEKKQASIPIGCVPPDFVVTGGGMVSGRGEEGYGPRRGRYGSRGYGPRGVPVLPPWTEWQTPVKTLPSHNFVCGR